MKKYLSTILYTYFNTEMWKVSSTLSTEIDKAPRRILRPVFGSLPADFYKGGRLGGGSLLKNVKNLCPAAGFP